MSYKGYLVKVGTYTVPATHIEANSYNAVINTQDYGAKTNASGVTIRNTLTNVKPIVTWKVPAMTEVELRPFLNAIKNNYVFGKEKERKVKITAFYPETGETGRIDMYMSAPEIVIDTAKTQTNGTVHYQSWDIKFTAYGGEIDVI